MMFSMEEEKKFIQMEILMKANLNKEEEMDKEFIISLMEEFIEESG